MGSVVLLKRQQDLGEIRVKYKWTKAAAAAAISQSQISHLTSSNAVAVVNKNQVKVRCCGCGTDIIIDKTVCWLCADMYKRLLRTKRYLRETKSGTLVAQHDSGTLLASSNDYWTCRDMGGGGIRIDNLPW